MVQKQRAIKPIDSATYGYLQALYLSFYSRALYFDVGLRWRGLGLIYMLIVIALFSIPGSIYMMDRLNTFYEKDLLEPLTKLPTIIMQDGEIKFDKPMPYLIRNSQNQVIAAIDTTGKIKTINSQYPQMRILITKDKIFYHQPPIAFFSQEPEHGAAEFPLREQSLKGAGNAVISGADFSDIASVPWIKYAFDLILYPAIVGFVFALFSCLMLAFALLGQLLAKAIFKFKISYAQSSRLIMVAATPMLFVYMVSVGFGIQLPGSGFIHIGILSAYFSYGVICVKAYSKLLART